MLCAAALAIAAAVLTARAAPDIVTKGDVAVTELYVQLASQGHLLVGPYSRFAWHHPGPLYFLLQAPLYVLSGRHGIALYVGALWLNLAALAVLGWILVRDAGRITTIAVMAALLLFVWRTEWLLASPWTAHVPILAGTTLVAIAASIAAGSVSRLPLFVLFGSFVSQTHLAFVPLTAGLGVGALAIAASTSRDRSMPQLPRAVVLSIAVGLALWAMPLVEQISGRPGNLAQLWAFFMNAPDAPAAGTSAIGVWSYALMGVLRPDLYTPYGAHFQPTHLTAAVPGAIVEILALTAAAYLRQRRGERFDAALAAAAVGASLLALWSITRVRGDILDHEIFWIVPIGALNLGVLAAAGVRAIVFTRGSAPNPGSLHSARASTLAPFRSRARRAGRSVGRRPQAAAPGRAAAPSRAMALACCAIAAAWIALGVRDIRRHVAFESGRRRENVAVTAAYEAVRGYLAAEGVRRPLFRSDDNWDLMAGVTLRLVQAGIPISVEGRWLPMFTGVFAPDGSEDAAIDFVSLGRHRELRARADNRILLAADPVYVDARASP